MLRYKGTSFNIFKRQNSTRSSSLSPESALFTSTLIALSLSLASVYSTHMFTSAMSLNVDVSSEFRNADATTSSLGAPILGVQSESPVSGTTSSCVSGGEYWVSIGCHYLGGIWVFEYVLDTNCSPARLRKTASAPSPCTAAPVASRGRRYRAATTTPAPCQVP